MNPPQEGPYDADDDVPEGPVGAAGDGRRQPACDEPDRDPDEKSHHRRPSEEDLGTGTASDKGGVYAPM